MQNNDSIGTPITVRVVSLVADAKATATRDMDAAAIIQTIQSGKWREPVEKIRAEFSRILRETDDLKAAKAAVRLLKVMLPGVLPSGRFSSRIKPTAERLLVHSGLLCADLDDLGERLEGVRIILIGSPHLWAMFKSPTGNGLKCWFRVSSDGEKHAASFRAVQQHVRDLTGEEIDTACSDVARLCFVSFDPAAWLDTNAVEVPPLEAPLIRLTPASAFCVSTSLPDCVAASLHHTATDIFENIAARNQAQRAFKARHQQIAKLYEAQIERRFLALPHTRNEFITEAIPFLYRAVAEHLILELVGHFYDCNRALFGDGREQHMYEAKAMLASVVRTYADSLCEGERAIYQILIAEERDTFRICRDFALSPEPQREPWTFFLSFDQLAVRLGIHAMQAQRIMRRMAGQGLLKPLTKGKRRELGVKAVAGTYKWLLSPPQLESTTSPSIA